VLMSCHLNGYWTNRKYVYRGHHKGRCGKRKDVLGVSSAKPGVIQKPLAVLTQLSQLRVILGIFAIIFVVKSCIFIAEL
jgi:hypothetical protein